MLRHTEFFQFPRQTFGKESSPHELHWAIRDAVLDAGAKIKDEVNATPTAHWSMTSPELVGKNTGCEADYVPFTGSIAAKKGRPISSKFWIAVIIGVCLTPIGIGGLILLGCGLYYKWVEKYHNGVVLARYDGVYRRPETGATTAGGVRNWEFQVDIMLSYRVEVPPFGMQAMGPEIVSPAFEEAINRVVDYARSGVEVERRQPQLVSARKSAYEERFPVQFQGDDSGAPVTI